jgi:hypothetical protein
MFHPYLDALVGGAMIGLAAVGLLLFNGRIAGISGILGGTLQPSAGDTLWRMMFLAGVVAGGVLLRVVYPAALPLATAIASIPVAVAAGLAVGIGTRIGSGCTSGHGVCGIGRLSPRSLVATLVFTSAGVLTVLVTGGN